MTITAQSETAGGLNRTVSENVSTLMFRLGWKQRDLARIAGAAQSTIGRKLKGLNDWTLPEVEHVASATDVTVSELLGALPDFDVWRARRDSNPKPSDLVSTQVRHVVVDLGAYRAGRVAS